MPRKKTRKPDDELPEIEPTEIGPTTMMCAIGMNPETGTFCLMLSVGPIKTWDETRALDAFLKDLVEKNSDGLAACFKDARVPTTRSNMH